ncbi:7-cyano-7-deazaguanine synthase [Paenibacillus sp. Dod16]|uniref:7-cyano-7-deazaguanine synthase n=1 Tax=Paenibacillus sp. Dod16 TaxID=3416392 RepID=UPI003CEB3DB6
MKKKAIVMVSGGPDSSTLLYHLKTEFELVPVYFDYGQNASDYEIVAARKISEELNLHLEIIDISSLRRTFLGLNRRDNISLSINGNCPVALLSIAGLYATERNIDTLLLGVHKEDFPEIKNITSTLNKYSEVLEEFNNKHVEVSAPFITKKKKEVFELAKQLNVPFELTRSCERNSYIHCGECNPCKERVCQ